MFKVLLAQRPTLFSFLSGLMVSIATSAFAQIAFAEKSPANEGSVIASGVCAMLAGICWFFLSENLDVAHRRVDSMATALHDRDAAIASLPARRRQLALIWFSVGITLTIGWPFPSKAFTLMSSVAAAFEEHLSTLLSQ